MGNRGLLRSMQRVLDRAGDAAGVPFGHVVLAAPDVDGRVFRDLADASSEALPADYPLRLVQGPGSPPRASFTTIPGPDILRRLRSWPPLTRSRSRMLT